MVNIFAELKTSLNRLHLLRTPRTILLFCVAGTMLQPHALAQARQAHHTTATAQGSKALTKSQLEKALRTGGVTSSEMVAIIRKRGVDFTLDHDTELELRGAGADANIVEAVSLNYRPPEGAAPPPGTSNQKTQAQPALSATGVAVTPPSAAPPLPPPAPTFRDVTIPAGTALPVQLTQTLDSGVTTTGQAFNGVLSQDIVVGNMVVVPRGAAIFGHVTEARDAAHFAGSSRLTLALSSITVDTTTAPISVNASPVSREGNGRGKSTAGKAAGGAAVGAVLGGIFGGGKGAAIGAAAGGGAGAGTSAVTKGQQVQFTSESIVQFSLVSPLLVRVYLRPPPPSDSPRQPLPR